MVKILLWHVINEVENTDINTLMSMLLLLYWKNCAMVSARDKMTDCSW